MSGETLKVGILGDESDALRAFDEVAAKALKSTKDISAAEKAASIKSNALAKLGIRSNQDIRAEIDQVNAAYKRLAFRGMSSSDELVRASKATKQKVAELNLEIKGGDLAYKKVTGAQSAHMRKTASYAALGMRSNRQISQEIRKVEAAYKRLKTSGTASQAELARASKVTKTKVAELNKELKGASQSTDMLAGSVGRMVGAAAIFYGIGRAVNTAEEAIVRKEAALLGLESAAKHAGTGIDSTLNAALALSADGMMSNAEAARSLKNLLIRGFGLQEATDIINRFKDSAAFGRQASLGFGESIAGATEGLKNENSMLVDNAGVTKNVSVMWSEYAKQLGIGEKSLTIAQKRQAEYNGIMRETAGQIGNAAKASSGLQGAQARANKTATEASEKWGKVLTPALKEFYKASSSASDSIGDMSKYAPELATGLAAITAQFVLGKVAASQWAGSLAAGTITMGTATAAAKTLGKSLLPLAAAEGVFKVFELGTVAMDAYAASQAQATAEDAGFQTALKAKNKLFKEHRQEIIALGLDLDALSGKMSKTEYSEKVRQFLSDFNAAKRAAAGGIPIAGNDDTGKPLKTPKKNIIDPAVAAKSVADAQALGAELNASFDDSFTKISDKYVATWSQLVATQGEGSAQVMALESAYQGYLEQTWAKESAAQEAAANKVVGIQAAKYARIQAQAEEARLSDEERIQAKLDTDLQGMEDEKQRLLDQHLWTADLDTQFIDAKLARENAAANTILQIRKKSVDAQANLEKQANAARMDLTSSGLGAVAALVEGRGKKAFEFAKVLKAGEVVVSTAASMQKAYESQLSIPTPDAPFRAAAAAGIAGLKGAAHLAAINSAKMGGGAIPSSGGGGSTPSPTTISDASPVTSVGNVGGSQPAAPVVHNYYMNYDNRGAYVGENAAQEMAARTKDVLEADARNGWTPFTPDTDQAKVLQDMAKAA